MVTALHRISNGEVWLVEEIPRRKTIIEDAGLVWPIVESVPIREDIKTHTGNYEQRIANYQQTLRNLVQCGIRTVCYNFMPVLDWTHTDFEHMLPDGSKALRFDQIELAAFEIHIPKHPSAEADYTEEEITQAAVRFTTMSDEDKARLTCNTIASHPGVEEGYTLDRFHKHLELYKDIDKAKLRENFAIFLRVITPVAEGVGVRMAVHPDDPPHPILGLPRVVSTIEDTRRMVGIVSSMVNSFIMCTGSCGVRTDSDLADMIEQLGPRIYPIHLRSTMRGDDPKASYEATHLNGDVDMYEVVRAIVEEERHRKAESREDLTPMRPDHGHQMLNDLKERVDPGYSAIDHLKGLVGVRDVELTIQRALSSRQYPPA